MLWPFGPDLYSEAAHDDIVESVRRVHDAGDVEGNAGDVDEQRDSWRHSRPEL
jgi:hypothetical protein